MLERDIVKRIREHVSANGGKCYKLHGSAFSSAGAPDLMGNHRGVPFAIEVKRLGNVATPLQAREIGEWAEQGWVSGVATSVVEFEVLFEEWYEETGGERR